MILIHWSIHGTRQFSLILSTLSFFLVNREAYKFIPSSLKTLDTPTFLLNAPVLVLWNLWLLSPVITAWRSPTTLSQGRRGEKWGTRQTRKVTDPVLCRTHRNKKKKEPVGSYHSWSHTHSRCLFHFYAWDQRSHTWLSGQSSRVVGWAGRHKWKNFFVCGYVLIFQWA